VSDGIRKIIIFVFLLGILGAGSILFTGCRSQPPVVIDTSDIDRVRAEFAQLREQYHRLELAHRELAESSQFFIEFYRRTSEAIESGLDRLAYYGTDSLAEISRLRELVGVLGSIVQSIIDADAGLRTGEY